MGIQIGLKEVSMKRISNTWTQVIVISIILCFLLAGCTNFATNTKNTIGSAGITYNQSMKAAADLKKQDKISDTQWAQIDKYGKVFYVAYNGALDAFEAYLIVSSADAKAKVTAALVVMATELAKVNDYINVLKGGGK